MTKGVKTLRKTQFSVQSAFNTVTAGTNVWRGPAGVLKDSREVTEVAEDVGYIGDTDRSYIAKAMGELDLPETELTFEQGQYPFVGMGWGNAAGSAQGTSGSTYVFTTTVPTTAGLAAGTPFTFYTGDDAEALLGTGFYCVKTSFKWKGGEAVKISSSWKGKDVNRAPGGTFPTGTLESVEEVITGAGTFYLNAVGTNYGATVVSNQMLEGHIDIESIWKEKYTEGGTTPSYMVYVGHKITGGVTFEHDSAGSVVGATSQEHTNWKGGTAQRMRLQWTGSTISSGTTFTNKTFRVDLPIKWKTFEPLSDDGDNDTVTGTWFSKYNSTAGDAGTFVIARGQSLP